MTPPAPVRIGIVAVLAGAGVFCPALAADWASAAPAVPVPPPSVVAGRDFVTSVPGFAPGAAVERRLDGVRSGPLALADRVGVLRVRVVKPAPGRHRLVLVGPGPATSSRSTGATQPVTGPAVDPQALLVVVPRLVALDFRVVRGGLGVDAASGNRGNGNGGGNGNAAGGGLGIAGESATASTGRNLLWPAAAGAALVVLGGALAALGGRRRPRHA